MLDIPLNISPSPSLAVRVADIISDVMSVALFFLLLLYAVTVGVILIDMQANYSLNIPFVASVVSLNNILLQMSFYCAFSEEICNTKYFLSVKVVCFASKIANALHDADSTIAKRISNQCTWND